MKRITVIGAGNASHGIAADMALKGHQVSMLVNDDYWDQIEVVAEKKQIVLHENGVKQRAEIHWVTNNPAEAIPNAEFIVIPIPAYGQDSCAEWIADHLSEGQILLLTPGNFGSLTFREILKKKNISIPVLIAETNETPFGTRITDKGQVMITGRNSELLTASVPHRDTDAVIEAFREILPLKKAENIVHCAMHGTNPCYHVPGCILNAGRIERAKGQFYLYEEGITPSVARVMESLDQERIAVLKALKCSFYSVPEEMAGGRQPRSMWEELNGCQSFEFVKGPESLKSRYLTEDIPYGLMAWQEIADLLGVKAPVMHALSELGGLVLNMDLRTEGRTAEKMGIAGMSEHDLKEYIK